jgi:hypothetical protein
MRHQTVWKVVLEQDPETGEVVLPFPEAFLTQEDWRQGDVIRFEEVKRGSMKLINVTKLERERAAKSNE